MQVMQGAQGGHCCSRHHEGHPRVLGGGGSTVSAGFRGGGGGCSSNWALCPSEGRCAHRHPRPGEGAGGPAGPGAAVLPRGGTQEQQRSHGRASEEGTQPEADVLPPRRDTHTGGPGVG